MTPLQAHVQVHLQAPSAQLLEHLASWRSRTIVVLGDFMLDQMVLGDAERLTADAPVPVLNVREMKQTPGGAANVCMNLAALNMRVCAVGVVGDDAEGRALVAMLRDARVQRATETFLKAGRFAGERAENDGGNRE